MTLLSMSIHYKIGPQDCSLGFGQHSVCLYLLMLHDITTLEELSHAGLITLYLQSNTEDNEGLEMRLMGKYVNFQTMKLSSVLR